ncbi:MAG: aromatic ring-hydroxylating dioxygenase subunit alpha [Gammaproteobacteria bacterium]|nr:aromatic ring-hydroxylating dioxygenase subunit alpha [Gammaproteobacteria bacterium]NND39949.1 aromatic ring-hydroxylating dioxygenase subunit alpha [Pseudomonadales bacterium]NNL12012.1 aromatic ring-hydroxylating dioxygenase subunit alpha [Pseudomonadales bacterium]NNM12474.1 aromatic ring-hydroxylating dioxygenase subunit alpha [Pseudomonadales bacterium]RZV54358.1 MAG: aromatic ring-hydroxylating dioxygenase subunit alpha [Pseudomonadales bacterium]
MKAAFYRTQIEALIEQVKQNNCVGSKQNFTIPVQHHIDPERLAAEKKVFARTPLMIAHSSELSKPGDYLVREIDGRSWLLVRGEDGRARAFLNYCQHRGTLLLDSESGNCGKKISCPYHAWTYSTAGDLKAIPHRELFPDVELDNKALKQGGLQEAYGFLWLSQLPSAQLPIEKFMGGLHEEMQAMQLQNYSVFFNKTRTLNANWKLPLYAFLEPYHIGVLHKNSIADFFIKNIASSERFGPHIRSYVPRKNVLELESLDWEKAKLSEFVTPTNLVFPNVCMISHPTSISVIAMFPGDSPDTCSWQHWLLVPEMPGNEKQRQHYEKSVALLDGITYMKEDFWVSEQIQKGLNAGALDELTLGINEFMIQAYCENLDNALDSLGAQVH